MKKIFVLLALCVLYISCNDASQSPNNISDYPIIPKPDMVTPMNGEFVIDDNTSISATDDLKFEAQSLKGYLNLTSDHNTDGNIQLQIDNNIANKEGYTLSVSKDNIVVSGSSAAGVFYGIQSLRQLLKNNNGKISIPAVNIADHPRFEYRGMHLDVSRHFYDVATVKEYIDIIALHKMNKFHWHLTDDQGWRIEIKKYPKLTEVGGQRNGTIIGHHPGEGNTETPHGGFYTQEQVREIVKYAMDRHITVIPEIELPGHSGAAIAAYPWLSCFPEEVTDVPNDMMSKKSRTEIKKGKKKIVQESWGIFNDIFVPSERTFAFFEDVFSEIIPLFPSKYIHIGGDECPKKNWERSKFCQNLIKKLNLKNEHGLQSYFVQRVEKFLNSKGKSIIGWNEILEGGLAPNATVMSWQGIKGGIAAAKQKHNAIMTPYGYCYLDYYQAQPTDKEPLSIGGHLPVEKVYSYEPMPKELSKEEQKYIIGSQTNLWTEYIPTLDKLEYMLLPRMTAMSEVVWSSKENRDWGDFKNRLNNMATLFDQLGYNYAKHVMNGYKWNPEEKAKDHEAND